jgi:hypothetical protein
VENQSISLNKNEVLGFYNPSFFFIKINSNESLLDLQNTSDENQATFIHEYVGFPIPRPFKIRVIAADLNFQVEVIDKKC